MTIYIKRSMWSKTNKEYFYFCTTGADAGVSKDYTYLQMRAQGSFLESLGFTIVERI
jgi:hypothetical protein